MLGQCQQPLGLGVYDSGYAGLGQQLAGVMQRGDSAWELKQQVLGALSQAQLNSLAGMQNMYAPPEYDLRELEHATRLEF